MIKKLFVANKGFDQMSVRIDQEQNKVGVEVRTQHANMTGNMNKYADNWVRTYALAGNIQFVPQDVSTLWVIVQLFGWLTVTLEGPNSNEDYVTQSLISYMDRSGWKEPK